MAAIRGLGCDFGASVYLRQAFQWYCTPQGTSRISWIFNWRSVSFSPLLGPAHTWYELAMALGRAPSNRGSTFPRVHQCSLGLPFPRFHSTLPGCFSGINHGEPWCRVFQGSSQHSWFRGRGVDFFNWYTWQSPIGHVLLPVHGGADCNLISTFPRAHQCSLRLPFPRFHITPRGCIGFNIQNWGLALATAFPRFHASTSVASGCHFHVSTAPHKVA